MKDESISLRIEAKALTPWAFAPYGLVLGEPLASSPSSVDAKALSAGVSINGGTGVRVDHPAPLDLTRQGGSPCLTLFKTSGAAHQEPFRLRAFERHQQGGQTFAPLGLNRCLVVVAPGETEPDLESIEAFVVEPGQVVTLLAAVWHHPLLSVGPATVLVLERQSERVDCQIEDVTESIVVTLKG